MIKKRSCPLLEAISKLHFHKIHYSRQIIHKAATFIFTLPKKKTQNNSNQISNTILTKNSFTQPVIYIFKCVHVYSPEAFYHLMLLLGEANSKNEHEIIYVISHSTYLCQYSHLKTVGYSERSLY